MKSCTASARCYPKCRATNGRSSPISGCFTRGCTGTREKSWFHGRRIRPMARMEPRHPARLGTAAVAAHDGLRRLVQHLNYVYKNEPALWDLDDTYEGFDWIDFHDADNSVVSFLRKSARRRRCRFIVNATPVVRYNYRLGVPIAGFYREIINTDGETYGGSNVGKVLLPEATSW
jgi:1,4-alpha-glucan branching enzyme